MGSTRVARRAGIRQATNATPIRIRVTLSIVRRSVAPTPKRKLCSKREQSRTPTNPMTKPAPTKRIPCSTIRRKTSDRCAPSAIRIPISCERCVTSKSLRRKFPRQQAARRLLQTKSPASHSVEAERPTPTCNQRACASGKQGHLYRDRQ